MSSDMKNVLAVGYCRVSTEKQENSLQAQEKQIRAMAVVKGWTLVDLVVDSDAFSGNLDRPGVQRVLEMAKAREVGAVIISKLDRLTRSTRDVITLVDLFNKKRVALVSLAESLDTHSPMGRFFVRMIASMAELEREAIGERTRAGMRHLKSLGMPVGTVPYGWCSLGAKQPLIKDAHEQRILNEIHRLRDNGYTYQTIAEMLNELGERTRKGTEWRFQYVARILQEHKAA